ncbi:23049_t:CDS:2 [Cetraspora pellucida]|uniref:23049_t:CDS:1 n=1 Tax=Cetraspora pellucida TaxID=1433469 RepID=A0A9N9DLJ3_9GLOM|nr:23049_t:CDS:2 [Cetraspora pellucida]
MLNEDMSFEYNEENFEEDVEDFEKYTERTYSEEDFEEYYESNFTTNLKDDY